MVPPGRTFDIACSKLQRASSAYAGLSKHTCPVVCHPDVPSFDVQLLVEYRRLLVLGDSYVPLHSFVFYSGVPNLHTSIYRTNICRSGTALLGELLCCFHFTLTPLP